MGGLYVVNFLGIKHKNHHWQKIQSNILFSAALSVVIAICHKRR
jgi:hypothetical protein